MADEVILPSRPGNVVKVDGVAYVFAGYTGDRATHRLSDVTLFNCCSAAQSGFHCDELLAYWKFDETSGTRRDSIGPYDLTQSVAPAPGWVAGLLNNAVQFNAAGENCYNMVWPFNTVSFALSTWVRVTTAVADNTQEVLIRHNSYPLLEVGRTAGVNELRASFADSDVVFSPVTLNQWYHCMIVVESDGEGNTTQHFYVNSALVGTETGSTHASGNTQIAFGAAAGVNVYADVDETAFWAYPTLVPTEHQAFAELMYNDGAPVSLAEMGCPEPSASPSPPDPSPSAGPDTDYYMSMAGTYCIDGIYCQNGWWNGKTRWKHRYRDLYIWWQGGAAPNAPAVECGWVIGKHPDFVPVGSGFNAYGKDIRCPGDPDGGCVHDPAWFPISSQPEPPLLIRVDCYDVAVRVLAGIDADWRGYYCEHAQEWYVPSTSTWETGATSPCPGAGFDQYHYPISFRLGNEDKYIYWRATGSTSGWVIGNRAGTVVKAFEESPRDIPPATGIGDAVIEITNCPVDPSPSPSPSYSW